MYAVEDTKEKPKPYDQMFSFSGMLARLGEDSWGVVVEQGVMPNQFILRTRGLEEKYGWEIQRVVLGEGSVLHSIQQKWLADILSALEHEEPLCRLQEISGCTRFHTTLELQSGTSDTHLNLVHFTYVLDTFTARSYESEWLETRIGNVGNYCSIPPTWNQTKRQLISVCNYRELEVNDLAYAKGKVYVHFRCHDTITVDDVVVYGVTLRDTAEPCLLDTFMRDNLDTIVNRQPHGIELGGKYVFSTTLIVNRLTGEGVCSELTSLERVLN